MAPSTSSNSPDDLRSMGLQNMDGIIQAHGLTVLNTLNHKRRADLLASLVTTDYDGFKDDLTDAGDQAFASTAQAVGKKCNFPVIVHRIQATIPKDKEEDIVLPEQSYMNMERQAQWSRTYLRKSFEL